MKNPAPILIVAPKADVEDIGRQMGADANFEALTAPENIEQLLKEVESLNPRIVIIDIDLCSFDWASAIYEIKNFPQPPGVIVFSKNSNRANLLSAFRDGADAYLAKDSLNEDLLPSLQAVEVGHIFYKRTDADAIQRHMLYLELGSARYVGDVKDGISKLTVREKEVFPLLADGSSIKEVAKIMAISPKTVETHKYHIMKKLHLTTMADLTKLALIKDLIPI